MSGEEQSSADGPNRIMVFLRIRPAKKGEIDPANGSHYLLDVQPDNKTAILESKNYCYDWIFAGDNVQQEDIYKKVAEPVTDNVFKGFWGTVMVYGQTGTGKSFTMCNFDPKQQGIIPRTMRYIFDTIEADKERTYTVCFSFIQIYLDKLQDLFDPEAPELKINRDKDGVSFPGIKEHIVKDADDFRRLYDDGNQYRVITATKMNPESSRGHAALFIQIKSVPKDDPAGENRNGKLFLIDLAGYERFSKTGVQEGIMAQEAKTINASLLSLGNVVQALSDKSEHVPWRNAKLTRMLEDAIGGRAKCSIILTAGPSSDHLHETLGTLYFGSRAMAVKTNAKLAVNIDYKKLAAKLQEMLNQAAGRISTLEMEATRRQLEREEAEVAFQAEWARVKKRQEEQLQQLLLTGGSREKIEELIRANEQENALLEEQHYQQRQTLEERLEEEVQDSLTKQQEAISRNSEESTALMSRDISELQRQLSHERSEKEKFKTRCKEAEAEARRLLMEVNESKMKQEGDDLFASAPDAAGGASPAKLTGDLKREFERRVETVRTMLEDNFSLKLTEVEEPLREELEKYKKLYEDTKLTKDTEVQAVKDKLVASYESEIAELRKTSSEVQEKLKRNHLTIKKSYQDQKERVERENDELTSWTSLLQQQIQKLGQTPVSRPVSQAASIADASSPSKSGSVSLDRAGMSPDRTVDSLLQKIKDLQSELDYVNAEKEGLTRQSSANFSKAGDERLTPAQIRALRTENEDLKQAKQLAEMELMKLKAQQILTAAVSVTQGNEEEEDDDDDEPQEEILGDMEGLAAFADRLSQKAQRSPTEFKNTFQNVSSALTPDLKEYRQFLRYRFVFLGAPSAGKSLVAKCMYTATPMIKSLESTQPTTGYTSSVLAVEDLYSSRADWHRAYVLFKDPEQPVQQSQVAGGLFSVFGGPSQKTVADPASVVVEIVDLPGGKSFLNALPPNFFPSKNVVFCVVYNMTAGMDLIRSEIEAQLTFLQANVARSYPKHLGGDSPQVAFALIGTHRDELREKADGSVIAFLNKLIASLGDVFFRLRGEDTAGLVCVGNFATSARDWTVLCSKGDRGPRTFRDLAQSLTMTAAQLYPNTPTHLLPSSKETVSRMSYVLGDEASESVSVERTSHLLPVQQRLRKGIITLVSGLQREVKARWAITEAQLRSLVVEHLDLDLSTPFGVQCCSFVIRELAARGAIAVVPAAIIESKYLPPVPSDATKSQRKQLPREGCVIIDATVPLKFYSALMNTSVLSKESKLPLVSQQMRSRGLLQLDMLQNLFQPLSGHVGGDLRVLVELLSVAGLGICLRAETSILCPGLIVPSMSKFLTDYIPHLLAMYGDGVGRRYKLNAATRAFFAKLQTKLVPFSNAPARGDAFTKFNWADASLLVLEKTRLKWGIFGSRAVKDAVMAAGRPFRGLLKLEGDMLYVVVTAQGSTSVASIEASRTIVDAIHREIRTLCSRDFRGLRLQFQEMVVEGCERKRHSAADAIETIMNRHGLSSPQEIADQKRIIGTFATGKEVEEAVLALRTEFCDDE